MINDINMIMLSGVINNVMDNNMEYIKFGITSIKNNSKVYVSLNVNRNLYNIYKDFFVKDNKIYIKGYINSYISNNSIHSFITVTDISNNEDEINNGKREPHIRYDPDGVMVWNGKRCEKIPMSEKEEKELKELIKEVTGE